MGQFLPQKGQKMLELSDPVWLADSAFLADITRHLNTLNMSPQGQIAVVSQLYLGQSCYYPEAPVTNAAQYHTSAIAAGNDHFSRRQNLCANEEVSRKHFISD